MKLIALLY